jgi:retron-type reverse transcriptase
MGTDRTAVRRLPRTLLPDTVGSAPQKPPSLQGRANKAKTDQQHRFRDRYGGLDAARLLAGWRDLNKQAARGVAGLTAQAYEAHLQANLTALVHRLKTHRYRAKLVRRCYSPKANGTERPFGLPALEDNLVQLACAKLLRAIYEQDLLACRYGDRPGRGGLEAVRDLPFALQAGTDGSLVEAEGQGFCDQREHPRLWTRLRERIDARAFLRLLRKWLQAGMLETDGHVVPPETGSPHGGSISPVRANVYLHCALEVWCATGVPAHWRGKALLCRSADDWGCAFP